MVFHGYVSAVDKLPKPLVELKTNLEQVLAELKTQGKEKFSFAFADPEADGGGLASKLTQEFGMQPMVAGAALHGDLLVLHDLGKWRPAGFRWPYLQPLTKQH